MYVFWTSDSIGEKIVGRGKILTLNVIINYTRHKEMFPRFRFIIIILIIQFETIEGLN